MAMNILNDTQKELFINTMINLEIGNFFYEKRRDAVQALGEIAVIELEKTFESDENSEKIAEIDGENAWTIAKGFLNNNKLDISMSHAERQKVDMNDVYNKAQDRKIRELVFFAEEVVKEIKAVENGGSAYDAENNIQATKAYKTLFPFSGLGR